MARMVVALIHEHDGNYGISFPDFPGAIAAGRSEDEAIERGAAILATHVRGMIEDDETLPATRSIEELRRDHTFNKDAKAAFTVLVPFDVPGRSVRLNISMDENLLDAVDRAANRIGQSRSSYLADAARERLKSA